MTKFRALWMGNLPLGDAFWTWVVFGGLLVNISTSIAFLALITADRPWAALTFGYGLSLPYKSWRWSASGGQRRVMMGQSSTPSSRSALR